MAEITYSGRGSRGAGQNGPVAQSTPQAQLQAPKTARPSSASPRLEGNPRASRVDGPPNARSPPSAQRMLAFLDSAERAAAKQAVPPTFPSSDAAQAGGAPGTGMPRSGQQHQRPKSAAPLRASGGPRIVSTPPGGEKPPRRRQYGRVSLYDHGTEDKAPHQVAGPVIMRDLDKPRVGFPSRPPEEFLRSGEGLSLKQRVKLKEHLRRHPVNIEAPFVPGDGGVRLVPAPPPGTSPRPLDWGSSPPAVSQPRSLLRTYYDNGTLDFVSVRWRGNREDALVWARSVTRGPEQGGPHTHSYVSWAPEPPSELDIPTWLPIFIDGVREYDEPYRFLAIRGAEEMMLKAGDTLHTFAASLVVPLKAVLDTREPTTVAVALQLMNTSLALDPRVAGVWVQHYWQFAQVLNLFRSRGGSLVVDMGYNSRAVASCRDLAGAFMTAFEVAGGRMATAAVRRYSPGHDPAVTDASMARAAAKAAAREAEVGRQLGEFKPFTLF